MEPHENLERVALIRPEERDYALQLQSDDWGAGLDLWTPEAGPSRHYSREFPVHSREDDATGSDRWTELHECIVPFPSAPIYGINRKAEYGKSLARPNMHTLRVLRRPGAKRITRMFVLHNGLNEADSLRFYYRLADWILRSVPDGDGAACVIMPFPGHLMHFSYHGPFSETPLSRYLTDAGELFRQFLRYMVGMRWLLGIVTDSDAKSWMVGGDLPKPSSAKAEILLESDVLRTASGRRLAKTEKACGQSASAAAKPAFPRIGEPATKWQIDQSVDLLRHALMREEGTGQGPLHTHVVGYSLGGFLAQSVFFAWPQAVSSCTTICSGGAISSLSPTAFAHPEEWQSVLHALRPELGNSMLQGRLADDEKLDATDETEKNAPVSKVAGMPLRRYGYFQRIFDQVFLQEDRGSYKERLSEYGTRMLFVSGGEDPIVRPTNILDASPEEGITMLSVASMTHFLDQDPRAERLREKQQRDFWLPEAGGLIARAAIRAERVHKDERESAEEIRAKRNPAKVKPPLGFDMLSSSHMFESALDWVLETVGLDTEHGWLLVCRNGLPPAFVQPQYFERWGTALHHHDVRVQQYAAGLRRRANTLNLEGAKERTTLVVPEQLEHWFVDLSARFDPHSDAPSGRYTTEANRKKIWRGFERRWWESIRHFEAGNVGAACVPDELDGSTLAKRIAIWEETESSCLEATHLPDVWIGIQAGGVLSVGFEHRNQVHGGIVGGVESILSDAIKARKAAEEGAPPPSEKSRLEKDLEAERIRVVQVSAAEFNPRFRGKIERSPGTVTRLLTRAAVGLVRSKGIPKPAENLSS
ncbi:MAG TPA: hypothetical protein VFR04_03670 [Solirubrobacterales bacterium]|nr:hypothetical protein [Solirubrobacterales bacterium]